MAKKVSKIEPKALPKKGDEARTRNVSGAGFSKTFTPAELQDIRSKRQAMRKRLYAAG